MKSNIASLYEELRKAIDGGSESMTHDDALKQIAYWIDKEQAQQVAVADGWALVPIEPTPEMLRAAMNAPMPAVWLDSISARANLTSSTQYKAMLAAAQGAKPVTKPDLKTDWSAA